MLRVRLARMAMKSLASVPTFSEASVGELSEVFNHEGFLTASDERRRSIMLKSAESKYRSETNYPWDNYFGMDLSPLLRNRSALDLGCFTGGRAVAWWERYSLDKVTGIDVKPVYIQAATAFAALRGAHGDFVVGRGETLPFPDCHFDAVMSFDVFEHVQDLATTLSECRRVLKPGGMLFLVFPGYYHPTEHHLSLVTRTPCLHWVFSGRTLIAAYSQLLEERGRAAAWYKREVPEPLPWERGNTTNGTTHAEFARLVGDSGWRIVCHSSKPIGSVGRNASRRSSVSNFMSHLEPLTAAPYLRELLTHRVTYILER
jgi:SAM-dependent methyltransferase